MTGLSSAAVVLYITVCSFCGIYVEGKGKIYDVRAQDEHQIKLIAELEHLYDVWKNAKAVGEHAHVLVDEKKDRQFKEWLMSEGLSHSVKVEDVDALLKELASAIVGEDKPSAGDARENTVMAMPGFRLDRYHPLEEINDWMSEMARTYHFVKRFTVGVSYEGRRIYGLKLAAGRKYYGRPAFWLDGGMHAREWVSPATAVYTASKMIEEYGRDAAITELLNAMTVYIVPVVNVDGYSYTWINATDQVYRMWRKTRSHHAGDACVGTDPNRNFDYEYGGAGTSNDSCAETYRGPHAFSEPEVAGLAKYLHSIPNLYTYLTLHSFSQVYLIPYGFSTEVPPNFNRSMEICEEAVAALYAVHEVEYTCGSIARHLYACAGTSIDYASAKVGASFSFGAELRDTGSYGFLLPANLILPTARENYEAIKVFAMSYFT